MAEGTVGKVQDRFMSRPQPAHSQSLFSKRCSPHWGSWAGMWVSCSKLEHLIYVIVFLQVQKRYKVVPDILCLQSPAAPFCPSPLCSDTPAPSVDLVPWPFCPTQKVLPGSVYPRPPDFPVLDRQAWPLRLFGTFASYPVHVFLVTFADLSGV